MEELHGLLEKYQNERKLTSKGKLAAILYVSRLAVLRGLPLDSQVLVTDNKGQVLGLGKAAVQAILKDHGETRVLAEEGGRTSRGSLGNMQHYVAFLNELHLKGVAKPEAIERWWIEKVRQFFSAKPFSLKYDTSKSLRALVSDLLSQASKRQSENPGTTYEGALLQHLVGSCLSMVTSSGIDFHGYSVADAVSARSGDFVIDDVSIHVTTAPSEALLRKCESNISGGGRPIIITTSARVPAAEALASIKGIAGRVEIFGVEQYVAQQLFAASRFTQAARRKAIELLVDRYNEIVEQCETDPSLKVSFA